MNKIWFILIRSKREGPYSYEDLRNDDRLTLDTLVWREGFENWKKISDVPELKKIFKTKPKKNDSDEDESAIKKKGIQDELVLDMGQEPPFFLWILIALIALLYVVIQLLKN